MATFEISEEQILDIIENHMEVIDDDDRLTDFTIAVLDRIDSADAFMDWHKIIQYAFVELDKNREARERHYRRLNEENDIPF